MSTSAQIQAKIDKLDINMDRLDQITNGGPTVSVTLDNAIVVPSIAKFYADFSDEANGNILAQTLIAQAKAQAWADNAVDVSVEAGKYSAKSWASHAADSAETTATTAAAANASAAAALVSQNLAAGYASDSLSVTGNVIYATIAGMSTIEVPAGINAIRVNSLNVVGDNLGGYFISTNNGNPVAFSSGGTTARNWYKSYENPSETREYQLEAYRLSSETTHDNALERILALISGDGIVRITRPHDKATILASRHTFVDKNIIFGGGRNITLTTADAGLVSSRRTVSSQKGGFFKVEHADVTYNVARTSGSAGAMFSFVSQFIGSFDQPCGGFVDVNFRSSNLNDATITPGTPLYVKNGWYGVCRDCSVVGPINGHAGTLITFDGLSAQWSIDNPLARWIGSAIVIGYATLPALNFATATSFLPYETLTGATSGATATACGTDYGVTTRTLTTDNVGTFTNGETITGSISGYSQALVSQQTQKYPCEGFDITGGAVLSSNHFVSAFMPNDISRRAVGLRFLGGHGNCILETIYLAFFDQVTLIGGEPLYRQNGDSADITMSSCGSFYLGGFTFTGTGSSAVAINLATCGDGVIGPNNISLRNIGIQLTTGCARLDIHGQENGNTVTTNYAIENTCPIWPAVNGIRFMSMHDRPSLPVPKMQIYEGTNVANLTLLNPGVNASSTMLDIIAGTSVSIGSQFGFINCQTSSGTNSAFRVRGDGAVFSDGGTAMNTPADYAERFEWADGNPNNEDRIGWAVTFADGTRKIRRAIAGDINVFGIVSGNPTVIGDNGHNYVKQYLYDDFNRPVMETIQVASWEEKIFDTWTGEGPAPRNFDSTTFKTEDKTVIVGEGDYPTTATFIEVKRHKQNPDYDPTKTYVAREDRPEWDAIGLLGKLRMLKGETVNPRWIKMEDVSATIEEWLVI